GAHSNHLHALAGAGTRFDFRCVGLLRGHEVDTPTVRDLRSLGLYYEHLWQFALEQAPDVRLIAANLPVRDGGHTLGELDLLL
ncbi:DUF1853 family protein, partial [Pseudomonas aeruginosa]|uniref:DUF1853 family protein n=1 Tax=Pseudomonas aeruginosa TaxID=287 RepID=UPI0022373FF3